MASSPPALAMEETASLRSASEREGSLAMLSSFSSRLTYDSRMSRRAPGRAAEMASAACTIIASSDGQSM
ncbi:MAG: hypothetical protein AAB339_05875, partial [Elusimicrobiota bacterium]